MMEGTPARAESPAGATRPRVRLAESMLALAPALGEMPGGEPAWVSPDDQASFVSLLLGQDPRAAEDFVGVLAHMGVPRDAILRGLLLGAASDISDLWDRGECSFVELSVAAARLQGALEILNARARDW